MFFFVFFFFQAEDGIRDRNVTGVQTCALPICSASFRRAGPGSLRARERRALARRGRGTPRSAIDASRGGPRRRSRSEERRVGKECRSRWWRDHEKKKEREDRSEGEEGKRQSGG